MPEEDPREGGTEQRSQHYWLAVGMALGAGIGLLLGNVAIGIAVGIAIGVAMAQSERRRSDESGPDGSGTGTPKGPAGD